MSTINGLPAHVLLVHFVVVLAPLTAILLILCALWPAARHRLVWLTLALSAATIALTPLATDAGESLERRVDRTPAVHIHTGRGDTMIYFAVALVVVAVVVAAVHYREQRSGRVGGVVTGLVAVLALVVGVSAMVQVYRIGESGAQAVWGDQVTSTAPAVAPEP